MNTKLLDSCPKQSLQSRFVSVLVLTLSFVLLVALRLHLPHLEPEEALYAEIPREMLVEGAVVVPVLHGEPYLDKPPLLYWLVMGSYRQFGVHVWSSRLVSAVAAWLTIVVAYSWGAWSGGRTVGLAAAAVLALTGDFVYRGPMLTPNGLLALFTTAALAAGAVALRGGVAKPGWWVASALSTGLGVLTKGPVALVLVAPLFAWLGWVHGARRWTLLAGLGYLGVVTLVAGPWFLAVANRQPGFVEYFFWKHHVQRFLDPFDHKKPAYFYLPQAALGGLPWTLVLLLAAGRSCSRKPPALRPPLGGGFALATALWALAFFSASGSKRAVYLVPVWPPLAVAVGSLLAPLLVTAGWRTAGWARWIVFCASSVVTTGIVTGTLFWLPVYHRRFSLVEAADRVAAKPPGVPVYCYPHLWHALNFRFGSRDITSFGEADRDALLVHLRSHPDAVLVVKHGAADDLIGLLSGEFDVTERYPTAQATVLTVQKR